jgi:hypothetical protein
VVVGVELRERRGKRGGKRVSGRKKKKVQGEKKTLARKKKKNSKTFLNLNTPLLSSPLLFLLP